MTPSHARRWLLLADLCAMVVAVVGAEAGSPRLRVERSTLLTGGGVYLIATGVLLFIITRYPSPTREVSPGKSVLGRRGPAWLGYLPRLLLGAVLLAYAFRP
ncbi:MAG TPA: hypothetical protein VD994_10915 [Prosthecobacter sp.]|nr:hypothetical protein [Prosthecobacter sp.]